MSFYNSDIIAAIATPKGNGAIAVVRISGKGCLEILKKIVPNSSKIDKDRFAFYTPIIDKQKNHIDDVLLIKFSSPKSYTGEDMFELQCHGGKIIPEKVLSQVMFLGARHAEPGEFTRRAFLNGKMDLIQAESVDSLIKTSSKVVYEKYLDILEKGSLKSTLFNIRQNLIDIESEISAAIDFDEEDNQYNTKDNYITEINHLIDIVENELRIVSTINKLDKGISIALIGNPNSGKSTIFNLLCNDDKAIIHHTAGTTRDTLEAQLEIDLVNIKFFDTAGLRTTDDEIENIGIKKTLSVVQKCDFVLWIQDCTEKKLHPNIKIDKPIIKIFNKSDLLENPKNKENFISALNKKSRQILIDIITENIVKKYKNQIPEHLECFNSRHVILLKSILEEAINIKKEIEFVSIDIISIHLREILNKLDALFGKVYDEDILNNIFSKFCMGK